MFGFEGDGTASFFLTIRFVDDGLIGLNSGSALVFVIRRDFGSGLNKFSKE